MTDSDRQRLEDIDNGIKKALYGAVSPIVRDEIKFLLAIIAEQEEKISVMHESMDDIKDKKEALESSLKRYEKVVKTAKDMFWLLEKYNTARIEGRYIEIDFTPQIYLNWKSSIEEALAELEKEAG